MPTLIDLFKQNLTVNGVNVLADPKSEEFNQEKVEAEKNHLIEFCDKENFGANVRFLFAVHALHNDMDNLKEDKEALKKRFDTIQQDFLFDIAQHKIEVKPENQPNLDEASEPDLEIFSKAISEIITLLNIKILPKVTAETVTETGSPAPTSEGDLAAQESEAKNQIKKNLSGIADNTKELAKTTVQLVNTFSKSPEVNKAKEKLSSGLKSGLSSIKGLLDKKTPPKETPAKETKTDETKAEDNNTDQDKKAN